MGRPKLEDENRRKKHVAFYVSPKEFKVLLVKKGAARLSDWLRELALNADELRPPMKSVPNGWVVGVDKSPMRFQKK